MHLLVLYIIAEIIRTYEFQILIFSSGPPIFKSIFSGLFPFFPFLSWIEDLFECLVYIFANYLYTLGFYYYFSPSLWLTNQVAKKRK